MEASLSASTRSRRNEPNPSLEEDVQPLHRVALLSERQLCYLRHVYQHRSSKEIAALTGVSPRAVDKQLLKANNLLGAATRVDAARMVAAVDAGVEPLPPATILPSADQVLPLPLPMPTAATAANMLTWKQAAIWTVIIAIVTPIGVTVAGMVILTLSFLLGLRTG
ncbi:RNA polymerase subunit sigma-70 [Sphingomonas carotinifaciens]|uniref:RNA polymerase subunit sigma-70 n=2 Tax=Sphingomonas carotinifaciens TaxID=1166323 RepID=A0A6N8M1B8_9SPHN|nr:sigma factor-like helix-turn-helix DNA-binding protein [Sphingomonas carotinifaciens]MWC45648.1 RNA polymerase subunit sigma-70 [Sphingomonas carotinifaciens]